MGKHSSGGFLGSGDDRPDPVLRRRDDAGRARIPSDVASEGGASVPVASRRARVESAPARLRAERDRRRRRTRRILVSVLAVTVVLILAGVVAVFAYAQHLQQVITVKDREKLNAQLAPSKPGEPYNVLLLGADFRPGDTAYRTDTVIVARIDPQQKKIWMLSIPRDTKVLIPGHGYQKINSAHTFGGASLAVETVKDFTGLPIDHYMEVNFTGFENAVNQMGGIWVNVPHAIDDKAAASQSVHQRAAKIEAGYQKLDGEHALTFVRARHQFANQDIGRMGDQQIFFRALADQLAHKTDIPTTIRVVNSITPYIQTDMQLMDMLKTALDMKGAGSNNMYTATVPGTWVTPYQVTDQAKLDILVANFKNGEPFDKNANASDVPNPTPTTATGTVVPSKVKITVKNGWTTSGAGSQAATLLKTRGFKVMSVGNTKHKTYKTTLVIYKTKLASAQAVAASLMPGTQVVRNGGQYSSTTEILVIVGEDWDPNSIPAAPAQTQ